MQFPVLYWKNAALIDNPKVSTHSDTFQVEDFCVPIPDRCN